MGSLEIVVSTNSSVAKRYAVIYNGVWTIYSGVWTIYSGVWMVGV